MKPLKIVILLALAPSGFAATHYVDLNSAHPAPPYTNWATAAAIIQDAVDVAAAGDEVVVTNGVYTTGGRPVGTNVLANRVAVDKPLLLRSVNGPQFTIIQGYQVTYMNQPWPKFGLGDTAIRCVYLASGASLSGFTLTNGATRVLGDYDSSGGGGVLCESTTAMVSNCMLVGNSSLYGGAAYLGTLNNCTLSGNSAWGEGGGAYGGTLNNCTLTDNSAYVANDPGYYPGSEAFGGGAAACTLFNCTLIGNSANSYCIGVECAGGASGGGAAGCALYNCTLIGNSTANWLIIHPEGFVILFNSYGDGGGVSGSFVANSILYFNYGADYDSSELNYCCAPGLAGFGNITNAPLFAGDDLRLQSNSPCINAGNNDYVTTATDLGGNPRVLGGTVDIGAYEFVTTDLLVQHLIELVNESSLSAKRPLVASLEAALSSLQRGNTVPALNQLRAFQNKVNAQVEPTDAPFAAVLTDLSQDIVGALGDAKY